MKNKVNSHKTRSFISLSFLLFLFASCGQDVPAFDDFDCVTWKNDRYGCDEKRIPLLDAFNLRKDALIGIKEETIRQLLGKPDREELGKKSTKILYYFLENNERCESVKSGSFRAIAIDLEPVHYKAKLVSLVLLD